MYQDPRCAALSEKNSRYHIALNRLTTLVMQDAVARQRLADGCDEVDFAYLDILSSNQEKGVTITEIARRLHINASSVTRRVKHLADMGLAVKDSDKNDERRCLVRLTERGKRLEADAGPAMLSIMKEMYDRIPEDQMQCVYAFMDSCCDTLEKKLREFDPDGGI